MGDDVDNRIADEIARGRGRDVGDEEWDRRALTSMTRCYTCDELFVCVCVCGQGLTRRRRETY